MPHIDDLGEPAGPVHEEPNYWCCNQLEKCICTDEEKASVGDFDPDAPHVIIADHPPF